MNASSGASTDGTNTDKKYATAIATYSCYPGVATFPLPSAITADLPSRASPEAKAILARAIALCERRRPGFVFSNYDEEKLQILASDCQALMSQIGQQPDTASQLNDNERSFDYFFGIARHDSPDAFAIGVVWGLISMLHEVNRDHSLIPAELSSILSGFYHLAKCFLSTFTGERTLAINPEDENINETETTDASNASIGRWRNGHMTFVALTQGLILTHLRAIAAIESRNGLESMIALRDAACLFSASAAAMHLTGDVPSEDYDKIRELMSPPHVPEGFSGLFNVDHGHLMAVTKKLGVLFNQEWDEISWAKEEYWIGLSGAYSAHRWVCQILVSEAPSLGTECRASEQPAPEKLEGFARRALQFSGFVRRNNQQVGEVLAARRHRQSFHSTSREKIMLHVKASAFETMLSRIRGHQLAALIHLAARLEIADRIGGGKKLSDLAQELQVDFGALRRTVRALAAFDIFAVDEQDGITQTASSELLKKDAPSSLHAAAMFWGMPASWETWGNLEYSVKTGECAFEHCFDQPLFGYLESHPQESANFQRFMAVSPEERHLAVVKGYDFTRFPCVADIGGGNGMLLARILAAHPQGRGILYDRATVTEFVTKDIEEYCSTGRCQVIPGDFFDSVPKGADIYVLSQIIHDWDDEKASRILHNCRQVIGDGAVLLLIERVLDLEASVRYVNNFLSDIEMLVLHRAAERSTAEFRTLLEKNHFRLERVIGTSSPFSLIECVPA